MTEPTRLDPGPRVSWGVYVVADNRLRRPTLVAPEDELVLLAVVTPPAPVAVELYRGDALRDRRDWPADRGRGDMVVAVALGRGAALAGSSRLRCRLLVNGHEVCER